MVPEKVLHHVALHTLGTLRVQTPCDLKGARRGYMRIGESRSILPSMPQVRHLSIAESRKMPIVEINLQAALEGLKLTMEQFIDLCILCGCDYTDSIKGIGPVEYPVSPLSPMSHAAISPPAREVRICPPIPNGELTTACKWSEA